MSLIHEIVSLQTREKINKAFQQLSKTDPVESDYIAKLLNIDGEYETEKRILSNEIALNCNSLQCQSNQNCEFVPKQCKHREKISIYGLDKNINVTTQQIRCKNNNCHDFRNSIYWSRNVRLNNCNAWSTDNPRPKAIISHMYNNIKINQEIFSIGPRSQTFFTKSIVCIYIDLYSMYYIVFLLQIVWCLLECIYRRNAKVQDWFKGIMNYRMSKILQHFSITNQYCDINIVRNIVTKSMPDIKHFTTLKKWLFTEVFSPGNCMYI